MPLVKMGTAARRARMGSTTAVVRALRAAGVPLVTLSPGVFAVEAADLDRFLESRRNEPAPPPPPKPRPDPSGPPHPGGASGARPRTRQRRP